MKSERSHCSGSEKLTEQRQNGEVHSPLLTELMATPCPMIY